MSKFDWWVWLVPGSMAAFFFLSPYRNAGYTYIEGVLDTRLGLGVELVLLALVFVVALGIALLQWRRDDRPWLPAE